MCKFGWLNICLCLSSGSLQSSKPWTQSITLVFSTDKQFGAPSATFIITVSVIFVLLDSPADFSLRVSWCHELWLLVWSGAEDVSGRACPLEYALERRLYNWFTVCLTPLGPWHLCIHSSGESVCQRMCVFMCCRKTEGMKETGEGGWEVWWDDTGGFQGHCSAGFWALHQAHVYFINILPSCQSGRDSTRSPSPPLATHRGK